MDWRALKLSKAGFAVGVTKNDASSTFVPGDGFSQLHALPAVVTWAPTAPRSVSAAAGDGRAR